MTYRKIAQLKSVELFTQRLQELGIELPVDPHPLSADEGSPLAVPATVGNLTIGNRWCIHPMEGWDANTDGSPSDLTLRRWQRFGESGAKLIWGGEAAAVRPDGRANPNQTMAIAGNESGLTALRTTLVDAHVASGQATDDLVVGLQLTHSGRYCRPNRKDLTEPRIAYHHPILDARVGIDPSDDSCLWTDAELEGLIEDYVAAARRAWQVGFDFVDVKACHGYLLHEFLSARRRAGVYGGDLKGRAKLLLSIIDAIQAEVPGLTIGVRLSLFDMLPYELCEGVGVASRWPTDVPYDCGFGCAQDDPSRMDLTEPMQVISWLAERNVRLLNLSCGSPYYNPHIQRPAIFPPSDGYPPPEDPLVGVARQLHAVAEVKQSFPEMLVVGSGYTYLQDYLPHVAQGAVRRGMVDFVGLGRMVLSYPQLPRDVMHGQSIARKLICRTFSDCTTAPRRGMVSGCYPLDEFYKQRPERAILTELKGAQRES